MVLRVLQTSSGEACTNQCGWMRETEWCGWVHKAKRSSGLAERSGLAGRSGGLVGRSRGLVGRSGGLAEQERQQSFVEQQSFWVHKAKRSSGLAERRLGRVGEAAELCGAAEILGVPLTTGLQIDNNASKRFHCPSIMVTASRTPKTPFHSAFQPSKDSSTKYGYHQLRTTTLNDHPTSRTSQRISLWSSTITPPPGRKRILIFAQHWFMV